MRNQIPEFEEEPYYPDFEDEYIIEDIFLDFPNEKSTNYGNYNNSGYK